MAQARALTGLTGLAGYQVQIDTDSQASPEDRSGGIADPRHAIKNQEILPYPWEARSTQAAFGHGPYGPDSQLLGDEEWFWQAGGFPEQDPAMDLTPSKRAGPWPKGIASGPVPGVDPDTIARQRVISAGIHGIRTNAGIAALTGYEALNDEWMELYQVEPGHSDLRPIPKQAMASGFMWGTTDRTQSMARQNQYGFDSAHTHRRYAVGSIPGNTMWLRPGGRPLVKSLAGPARPAIGIDSPFAGDDLGSAFGIGGAVLQSVPTEYAPPPQPNLAAVSMYADESAPVVEWY